MSATFAAITAARPLLPPKYRYIAPYQDWLQRSRGLEVDSDVEEVRRSLGIRLGATSR
jgi:hypothetical protein